MFTRRSITLLSLIVVSVLVLTASLSPLTTAQEDHAEDEEHRVGVELVAEGFASPVALVPANDGSGRLFVVDQAGTIWILSGEGEMMPEPFLDLSGLIVPLNPNYDERGVLGLAFHPDYANNGRFFVYYTAPLRAEGPAGWDHTNILAEFRVSADNQDRGELVTQRYILQVDQPQFNHNAGHITFGPDGYLYVPLGDGGGANDTSEGHTPDLGNGQDTTNLHGSILRIDVDTDDGSNYAIPADNPFVDDDSVLDEIWAYGFRNPYHISFDRGGENALFVADAGQDVYEEISIATSGGNYGWNIKEGAHCFDPDNTEQAPDSCASTGANGEPLIDPIIEYDHATGGVVVVGGYVYRGTAMPELKGHYIFGDYSKTQGSMDGTLYWAEASAEGGMWAWGELKIAGMQNERLGMLVLGMGEDADGELYVLTNMSSAPTGDTGQIWKLVPAGDEGSETGGGDATADPTAEGDAESTPEQAATTAPEPTAPPAEPTVPDPVETEEG